jgi:biopolymer transport protein ExbD
MRFNPRRPDDDLRIELTSMTDIVFLLLIFFMVSTTFVDFNRRLDIQLPDTAVAEPAQQVQQHIIEIGSKGTLLLNGKSVNLEELTQQLQPQGQSRARSVIIRADKRLAYGRVVTVLGLVRQANISDIAVAVR